jgi:hypothetical protein
VPPYFTPNNSAVCLQLVFVCFVRLSEYTTFIFLPSVTRFVWNCPHCVLYATELNSYTLMKNYMFQDHAMDQVVSHCTFIAENQARSQASVCVVCGGQIGNGTGYPLGTSATTCHYYFLILHLPGC